MCFVWIWEQTAIISLYSINWLVCITETQCVYCAVRAGSLCKTDVNIRLQNAARAARPADCHCSLNKHTSPLVSHFTVRSFQYQYFGLYGLTRTRHGRSHVSQKVVRIDQTERRDFAPHCIRPCLKTVHHAKLIPGSSVVVVSRPRAGQVSAGCIDSGAVDLCPLQNVHTSTGAHPTSYSVIMEGAFLVVKQPGREADPSRLQVSSAIFPRTHTLSWCNK